ncbi:MAG: helix-turn-helix transcriptional regulator [Ruminococcaceae bacterium]|nr:helix-turn-helix transcriptional regulator [Oscillospiraceae bacterium]
MLHENIRTLRRKRGFSQEELACQLHVVRQTISKWEQGQSVPDAGMLVQLAEILEVPISTLLGEKVDMETSSDQIAGLLSRLNARLAEKDKRSRRRWRIIKRMLMAITLLTLAVLVMSAAA